MAPVKGGLRLSPNHQGALWMLGAATGFTLNSAMVKTLGTEGLHALQIVFFRGAIGLLVILPFVWQAGGIAALKTRHPWVHAIRTLAGTVAILCGFYAFTRLPLADVTAITFTTPLFAVVLAVLILGEPVRWRRWTATAVGFLGVLIMVRPGGAGFDPAALIALGMGFGVAVAVTLVKKFPPAEKQAVMLFYFAVGSTAISALPAAAVWRAPTLSQLVILVTIGVLGLGAQAMLIRAFRVGEASFVAPFDYSKLVIAGLIGFFVFSEVPDAWALIGAGVIVASTLYIARREATVGRRLVMTPGTI